MHRFKFYGPMMENDDGLTISGNTGEVAEPQSTDNSVSTEPVNAGDEEVATSKKTQDKETNAAFAEMRRQREAAEAKATKIERDYSIATKYGKEYGVFSEEDIVKSYGATHGIKSLEQFEEALKKADYTSRTGINPDDINELIEKNPIVQMARDVLTKQQQQQSLKQQDEALSNDPSVGEFYKQWRDEAMQLAEKHNIDLDAAFTFMCRQKLKEVSQKPDRNQVIKEYLEELKKNNKPVEGSGGAPVVVSNQPKSWEERRKAATEMLRQMNSNK